MPITSRNILISLFLVLIVAVAIQDGMFMDGQLYGIVAKNLAHQVSDFWHPWLSDSYMKAGRPYFMEHPPLGFFFQSLAFKILGDSMYTERIYEIIMALLHIFCLIKIWQSVPFSNKEYGSYYGLSIFFWLITPIVFWSFANNVMENTMGVFTSIAIWMGILVIQRLKHNFIYLLLFSISIFCASMVKGFPGLYPFAFFFLAYIFTQNISLKKTIGFTALSVGIVSLIYFLLLTFSKDAYQYLSFYVYERVYHRTQNELVTNSHFYIFFRVFSELLPALIFIFILYLFSKWNKIKIQLDTSELKWGLLFIALGLAGSLPIAITLVQKGFYVLASFVPFSIGLAMLSVSLVKKCKDLLSEKIVHILKPLSYFILIGSFTYTFFCIGKIERDKNDLEYAKEISKCVPKNTVLNTKHSIFESWSFQFFLIRYYDITLNVLEEKGDYFLYDKNDQVGSEFTILPCTLGNDYVIYKKNQ